MKIPTILTALVLIAAFLSCQKETKKDRQVETQQGVESEAPSDVSQDAVSKEVEAQNEGKTYARQSTDPQTAENLKNFLRNYTVDDYELLTENDKHFQFYKVDLNDDGNEEIFVRFMGPYFCGSGGCTFLLLDKYGEVLTRFTVTRAPIFIEPKKINEWSLLLVRDSGVFKELVFENGSYPSNPSVLPKAPYDAPSGHAEVMFDDTFARSKTFNF